MSISCKKSRFFKASSAGFGSMVGSYASPIISNRLGPKVSCGVLVPALLFTSYLLLAFASHLVMVLVARVVMGVAMGMARTLCPSYIQDVVHPRNSWLETCLPPTLAAAGILLGQVGTFLQYHYLMYRFCVLKTGPACLMGQHCVAFKKEHSPIHFLRRLAAPVI